MANVLLVGVERGVAGQIDLALAAQRHRTKQAPYDIGVRDLSDVRVVFAGGEPSQYLPLLRRVRDARPALPFVVIARIPEITAWLDALEAGATDYCSLPIETRQIHWLMESVLVKQRSVAV